MGNDFAMLKLVRYSGLDDPPLYTIKVDVYSSTALTYFVLARYFPNKSV